VNINRERFNLWGGGPGGQAGAARFRNEQQRQVAAANDRQALGSGETKHTVSGAPDLNVKVSAPAGTAVTASSSGLFQKTNIERNVQMTPATSGPAQTNCRGIKNRQRRASRFERWMGSFAGVVVPAPRSSVAMSLFDIDMSAKKHMKNSYL
jgi:hypothetical protein